jgi:hypothetical protein
MNLQQSIKEIGCSDQKSVEKYVVYTQIPLRLRVAASAEQGLGNFGVQNRNKNM